VTTARDQGLSNDLWHGLRLLAIDGSTLRLPKGASAIAEHFGGMDCRQGTAPPLARMSFLYEVRSRFIVAAEISPYEEGELTQARELLGGRVWEQDCVLYDRGYNDPRIIAWSLAQDSHFVIRVAVGKSLAAQAFVRSKALEVDFDYHFGDDVMEEFKGYGIALTKSCRLRFIRVKLTTGEVEVLLTNLVDRKKYPAEDFKAVYHERWTVEEGIKTSKCKTEFENWTGKTVHSIYQDFYARVLCQNLAAVLAAAAQPELDLGKAASKDRYKINAKRALGVLRDHFVRLVERPMAEWSEILSRVANRLLRAASVVRDGRSFPRGIPRRIPVAQPYKPII
jgi:hypothetical protein